jgi:hypothetical protein
MKVGAPDNRIVIGSKSLILTPRLETSNAGIWISRHRSARDYNEIKLSKQIRLKKRESSLRPHTFADLQPVSLTFKKMLSFSLAFVGRLSRALHKKSENTTTAGGGLFRSFLQTSCVRTLLNPPNGSWGDCSDPTYKPHAYERS